MKKLLSIILSLTILTSLLPIISVTVSASEFSGGDGSVENPYQIETPEQLMAIENNTSANYILIADIDLSEYKSWTPVSYFSGILDGNGYSINNIYIYITDEYSYIGLFGTLYGTIRNLIINNLYININGKDIDIGSIAGFCQGGTVENCNVTGTINANGYGTSVGGLIGWAEKGAYISNTDTNIIIVSCGDACEVGGLIGHGNLGINITNCNAYGKINASQNENKTWTYSGGLIGRIIRNITIDKCNYYGVLVGDTSKAAGLVGGTHNTDECIVKIKSICYYPEDSKPVFSAGSRPRIIGIENTIPINTTEITQNTTEITIPSQIVSFAGFPESLSITLGNLPHTLYVRGIEGVAFSVDNDNIISLQPASLTQLGAKQAVSAVWVTGKTPGTATITATAPDGTSAQCVVTVEGKITETIDDELILKAKICANNHSYKYMRDCWKSPSTVVTENADLGASKTYQGINDFIDACNLDYSTKNYYEIALMDMLNNKNIYYEAAKDATNNPFLKQALSAANKKLKENANANKVTISGLNYFDVDKFYNDLTFLDGILLAKDVGTEMYEKYEQIYMLTLVTDKQIKALEAIKSTTLNDDIKKACDTVIKAQAQAAQATANEIAANTAFAGADKLGDFVVQRGWDELTNLVPGMASAKLIVSAGKLVSNGIYNADKLSTDMLTMAASSEIEEAICSAMKIYENKFLNNQTIDNALNFMATADFYKQIGVYGCEAAIEYAEDIEYSANVQEAINTASKIIPSMALKTIADLNKIVGKCDTENITEFKRLAESIKRMTANYDFYDPCGNDIASYIRDVVSTTPSEWAKPYVDKAINYNLLDTDYQNNYQNNITRAEFCTLLTYLIENKSDISIEELAERAGRPAITVEFDDTMYVYVSEIAKLGIINGVGDNKFAPLGNITREQAAKMLCETARVLGYDISAPQTDLSGVSDWAKEGVNFVIDRDIMTGTDNGFEPQGTYTKEQAITTMVRFFENLK